VNPPSCACRSDRACGAWCFDLSTSAFFKKYTATRRNEAAEITRAELNGKDWIIPAKRSKSKRSFTLPLSDAARAILDEMPVLGSPQGYFFTTNGEKPLSGFSLLKRALDKRILALRDPKAPKLLRWTLHDLRRAARSLMSRAGVHPDTAERCLGHVIGGVRKVYDRHDYDAEKRAAFEALAALVERIVNPPSDNVVSISAVAR
jgi:integrase